MQFKTLFAILAVSGSALAAPTSSSQGLEPRQWQCAYYDLMMVNCNACFAENQCSASCDCTVCTAQAVCDCFVAANNCVT